MYASSLYNYIAIFGKEYNKYKELISNIFLNKKSEIVLCYGNNNYVLKIFLNQILEQKHEEDNLLYTTISLNGYIHTTEDYALKKICQSLNIKPKRAGFDNYQKDLEYYAQYNLKKNEIIVIYYDNFEYLMMKKKQILLYTLLEIINVSKNILLIGFTGNYNLIDLMEKRIRSRFSQKTMFITIPEITCVINGIEKLIKQESSKHSVEAEMDLFYDSLINENTIDFVLLINKYIYLGCSIVEIFTKIKYIIVLIVKELESNANDKENSAIFDSDTIIRIINKVVNEIMENEAQGNYFILLKNFPKLHITLLICLCHCASSYKDKITIGMIYQKYYELFHKPNHSGIQKSKLDLTLVKKYLEELANSNLISIKIDDKYGLLYELKLPLFEINNIIKRLETKNKLDNEMSTLIKELK